MSEAKFIPLPNYIRYTPGEMLSRSHEFYAEANRRRTVREFSEEKVPVEIIKNCIMSAGTAPSGANMQPWHFVVIGDPAIKKKIRVAAESEEKEFYSERAPKEWLDALAPLGTDAKKPFLEKAPYLIAVFSKRYDVLPGGKKVKQYYTVESTGIACGLLINALHNAGLASLTHTPSPMNFLNEILNRPKNEKPFLLLVTGYPSENAKVPDIKRKPLTEIATFI